MRMLMRIQIPTEAGNAALKDGSLERVMQDSLGSLRPEAMYLTTVDGCRGGFVVFNLEDVSQIPAITEPLFLSVSAKIELTPCFTPQELEQAGPSVQQAIQTYGS